MEKPDNNRKKIGQQVRDLIKAKENLVKKARRPLQKKKAGNKVEK